MCLTQYLPHFACIYKTSNSQKTHFIKHQQDGWKQNHQSLSTARVLFPEELRLTPPNSSCRRVCELLIIFPRMTIIATFSWGWKKKIVFFSSHLGAWYTIDCFKVGKCVHHHLYKSLIFLKHLIWEPGWYVAVQIYYHRNQYCCPEAVHGSWVFWLLDPPTSSTVHCPLDNINALNIAGRRSISYLPKCLLLYSCCNAAEPKEILRTSLGLIGLFDRPLIASLPNVQNVHPNTSERLHTNLAMFQI